MKKKTHKYGKTSKNKKATYKGLPLIDAAGDLEICVTKHDVSTARKNDPSKCAAANAIKREQKTEVEVHLSRTYVKKGKKWIRFLTPNSVSREITSFDRSAIFEPGRYILKAPTTSQQLGQARGNNHRYTGTNKKKQNPKHMTVNVRESAR